MKQKIDVESWVRKAHFPFFSAFEEPYFGLCVRVDCTAAYDFAKRNGISFYLYYVHCSLAAAQTVENFRYRIEAGAPYLYDQVDGGSTIARANGTFGFAHLLYRERLEDFLEDAARVVELVRESDDLVRTVAVNIIRYSAVPWVDFTSLSHARLLSAGDSCPFISFGKMVESGGRRSMAMSIHAHHALMDGLHVGQYVDRFQQLMDRS